MREDAVVRLTMNLGLEGAAKELEISIEEMAQAIEKARYRWDFGYFASERLKIIDKMGLLKPFVQNGPQVKLDEAVQRQVEKGVPVRICLLKARQWGGSTKIEGHLFRDSTLRANRSSMIVAHDLDSARHLREMSYRYYEYYDFPKPKLKKESDKWWKFQHKIEGRSADSHLRIDTADELSAGHSLTIHNLHLSEIQNWRNAQELVKGLFPTVPPSNDTMIFMEGTGSGVGNYWYDFCQMAMQDSTEWEFVFVPWFEIDDYTRPLNSDEKKRFEDTLDSEESSLASDGVSLEKLNWRRRELSETYKGDQDAFHQQYPATPDEAFITSGRPVFPLVSVKKRVNESKEPLRTGYIEMRGKKAVFTDDRKGYWKIWEEPNDSQGNLYVCGADVAEGIEVIPELGNRGGDFSAARILRRDTRLFCGTFHARIDPDLFAEELRKAFYFWKSPIFPEQNAGGGGNLVISRLRDDPLVKLIRTPVFGKKKEKIKDEFGWETTGGQANSTKRIAIDELNEAIREESFTDFDKIFWLECSTYVRDEKGKTNAQSRKFDDLVMATAITLQADKLMPMVFKWNVEKKQKYSRDMDIPRNWKKSSSAKDVMERNLCEF
jgi:hypothetical protein